MKKILTTFLPVMMLISACASQPVPVIEFPATEEAQSPLPSVPSMDESSTYHTYTNSQFGLSFQYPADWFGPDEYISDQTLRVAVGSDVVYPYGEVPDQPSGVTNSYLVVVQYSQNDQNTYWHDTYQTLTNLQDGESFSDGRGLIIRVREIDSGRFKGFEYIATLSENAQTEPAYSREVILVDEASSLITISGKPDNVQVPSGDAWQDIYKMIDEQNVPFFHQIVDSISAQ